ncbi:ER lumen protein retaining receptor [Taphrina deformans PYCC 5710]|uniref:ER lumen protein-retaining receptor n=1 Tax=Taphrina deformans (strain PYCC 5710 / ATCC 11124 / CBS 356.35 / IMI 108563 / JCM 9778 / NBRC 8474) TaxID=1097556 RepID=R4X7G6_TAPDE|nr:ER lumen protein retaining receptor [Taphrina deformans PYCC 5710]|eukprot:CCG81341.1 ER lumen protein retaining receptor [Taphrina deformans PYCC 5710]
MAILRLLGDFCHLTSILILIYKIHTRKTTAGISLRTRVLYLLVFLSRYGDLFLYYVSFYNTFMKILYLSTTAYIIYLMTINAEFKNTWYHDLDNFAILPLVIASFLLMFICTAKYTMFELSWTFSIILESVAILPQIDHLTKVPTLPALPLSHLVALGMYRGFYVLHWTVTLFSDGFWDFTVFFFGLIQTIIWADFLWVWYNRKQIKLPPNTTGQGARSEEAGSAEGQQVDESDMSSSFVLTHIIRLARQFEARYRAGRSAPLSVSAYPDRGFESQAPQSTRAYMDDVPSTSAASIADDGIYQITEPSAQAARIEVPAALLGDAEEHASGTPNIWGTKASAPAAIGSQDNRSEDGFSVESDHEEGSRPSGTRE